MRARLTLILLSLAAVGTLPLAGCYKRTVSTRGIGSYGSDVEQSYRSDTAADRWVDSLGSSGGTKRTKSYWVPRSDSTPITPTTPRPR